MLLSATENLIQIRFKLEKQKTKHLRPLFDLFKISTTPGMLPSHPYYETGNKTETNWFYVTPVCHTTTNL